MPCPTCHADNSADAAFCDACGATLEPACPACGTPNRAGARFCRRCGAGLDGAAPRAEPARYTPAHLAQKILGSRAALVGERKHVTVLFADVKGSMELAEQVDPETWHRILDRFFAILADGVHRFEGTVNQFTGDGIMALFGAPIAHEDHAQRACHAALHLRDALARYADDLRRTEGLSFFVRMGINSGEVVVGTIGDDLRMDYTAQGHTVGLAQRMEQLAEPGRVYLTGATAALVSGFFRLRDLGAFEVKGVREPVRVHELEGIGALRTRLDVSRARGFSRFVGRDDETVALDAAVARAAAGDGHVVGVVAEPGVGKSRLCHELVARMRSRGLAVYEAHGVAHGKLIPFLPVLELLRGFFGIVEQDGDQVARQKIAGALLLLDEAFKDALPLLFEFLGVPDPQRPPPRLDPEARQRELFAALRRLVRVDRGREAVVILIEDLHWIDGGSEAFLESLVDAVLGTRTLLVVNFRPEYHAGWMEKPGYRQLALRPLAPAAADELLRDLLGADPALDDLAARIRERTGGNPFFIEEVVQALVESGSLTGVRGARRLARPLGDVAIPATVQAVLAARIDRLAEREKAVLETAAVIGKEFSEPILRRVAGLPQPDLAAALAALAEAEFVYEEAAYPAAEYSFKHPLTHEVAYRSQLADRRARVHAAVATAIAEVHRDKLDERAALLSHHRENAGEMLEAARWSRRAAEWVRTSNYPEALRHWRKVRALAALVPDSTEATELALEAGGEILNLGIRLGVTEEERAFLAEELRAHAADDADPHASAQIVAAQGMVRAMEGDADGARGPLVEAVHIAQRTDDVGLQMATVSMLVLAEVFAGHLREATRLAEDALARFPHDPKLGADIFNASPYVMLLTFRGMCLRDMGHPAEGARQLEKAEALAREVGALEMLASIYTAFVDVAITTGDTTRVLEHARLAIEAAEKIGSAFSRENAYASLGEAHLLREEWPEAIRCYERALAVIRESGTGRLDEAWKLGGLAASHLGAGDARRGRQLAEEAVAAARRAHVRTGEAWVQSILARALIETEGAAAAPAVEAALDRATELVEETGARSLLPLILIERAALARLVGDAAGRARSLGEARRLFAAMGAEAQIARLAE